MDFDPLQNASPELLEAVEAMGGQAFLVAIDELVWGHEEYTVEWFDAQWDDLQADEIIQWSIGKLAKTGPTIAHAALNVDVRTYPVDEKDEEAAYAGAVTVTAFIRVVFGPQIRADRYELDFRDLGEWIMHDAIRLVDGPEPGTAAPE